MLPILALILLLFTPVMMAVIRILQPRFGYQYLLALFSALFAWLFLLISRPDSPQVISLLDWEPGSLFPYSPSLLLDRFSWPFALAVSALVLSVMLTASARLSVLNWRAWSGSLVLAGLGLLAVLAGNPLTLLIAWTALDISEAFILMTIARDNVVRQRIVLVLSARAAGITLLLAAMIFSWSSGETLSFTTISAQSAILLLLAAVLRLGILPLHLPFLLESRFRRGLGTTIRLAPTAASLILLSRTAVVGINSSITPIILVLAALAALYGAGLWVAAPEELTGRTFWIMGIASLAIGACVRAQPEAVIAWSMACLLSGALVFLSSPRNRYLQPLLLLGILSISGLPYTPLWNGWLTYGKLQSGVSIINLIPDALFSISFFTVHILLILGYLRHTLRQDEDPNTIERWVWALYIPGLAILLISHFIYGISSLPEPGSIPPAGWLSGIIISIISITLWLRARNWLRTLDFIPRYLSQLEPVLQFSWLYRILQTAYRIFGRFVTLVSGILEGEGGLLWAMLIVLLLFSFFRS